MQGDLLVRVVAKTRQEFTHRSLQGGLLLIFRHLPRMNIRYPLHSMVVSMGLFIFITLASSSTITLNRVKQSPTCVRVVRDRRRNLSVNTYTRLYDTTRRSARLTTTSFKRRVHFLAFDVDIISRLSLQFQRPNNGRLYTGVVMSVRQTISLKHKRVTRGRLHRVVLFNFIPSARGVISTNVRLTIQIVQNRQVRRPLIGTSFASIQNSLRRVIRQKIGHATVRLDDAFTRKFRRILLSLQ